MKPSLKIAAWLAGAALLVVVGVTASLWTFRQVEQAAAIRAHTHSLIDAASGLMSSLTDMETGQRGYLLTGDEAYLQPYLAEREKVTQRFDGLRATTLLAAAQRRLGALAPLLAAQLVDLDQSIELRRGQGFGEALTRLRHGQCKARMDAIRGEVADYLALEDGLLVRHDAEFASDMRRMFILIAVTSVLSLLFALAFALLLYRETQRHFSRLLHRETSQRQRRRDGQPGGREHVRLRRCRTCRADSATSPAYCATSACAGASRPNARCSNWRCRTRTSNSSARAIWPSRISCPA